MQWWMIALIGVAVWWLWPKLFGGQTQQIPPVSSTLTAIAAASAPPAKSRKTSQAAFAAMETLRDRMLECQATETEVDQLSQLAPVLLRLPPVEGDQ